jgi:hypothetical protein
MDVSPFNDVPETVTPARHAIRIPRSNVPNDVDSLPCWLSLKKLLIQPSQLSSRISFWKKVETKTSCGHKAMNFFLERKPVSHQSGRTVLQVRRVAEVCVERDHSESLLWRYRVIRCFSDSGLRIAKLLFGWQGHWWPSLFDGFVQPLCGVKLWFCFWQLRRRKPQDGHMYVTIVNHGGATLFLNFTFCSVPVRWFVLLPASLLFLFPSFFLLDCFCFSFHFIVSLF